MPCVRDGPDFFGSRERLSEGSCVGILVNDDGALFPTGLVHPTLAMSTFHGDAQTYGMPILAEGTHAGPFGDELLARSRNTP